MQTKRAISAHNAFTASLVSTMGFDYIWASSLEISSSFAKPDASILSSDIFTYIAETMAENSKIPVIMDCDSGYGNYINTYYALKKIKKAGVKGVCIEDNLFPKENSFYNGTRKILPVDEFTPKIKAAKDIFNGQDELVIARTESLINNYGMDEALERAYKYKKAGADFIMPHSKQKTAKEVFEFANQWENKGDLVAVPSTYPNTTFSDFEKNNFGIIIYANHTIRTVKKAIETIIPKILTDASTQNIEKEISPLKEVLNFSGQSEINKVKNKYLDKNG